MIQVNATANADMLVSHGNVHLPGMQQLFD